MIKRLLAISLALAMVFALCACGGSKPAEESDPETETETQAEEAVSGGWTLAENDAAELPEEVQKAFDKAAETLTGNDLKPVAFIAEQVVAGKNYMLLCESTPVTEDPQPKYQVAVVYADLEGNAEFTYINDFDLTSYTEGNKSDLSAEQLAGGWSVPEEVAGSKIPDDAQEVFNKATAELDGNNLEPMALLGTQVVAGTNYAYLCKSTLTTQEPVTGIQVVTVYADLEGNTEITNISTVDPADYNK